MGHSRNVGVCIYCGTQEPRLNNEHVIPLGINGNVTLLRASCDECARETSVFERRILRDAWQGFRLATNMRSRRKKRQPAVLPIEVRRGTEWSVENIPIEDHPAILALPLMTAPAYLSGHEYERGVILYDPKLSPIILQKDLRAVANRLGVDDVTASITYSPVDFARLIAKIGFGMAVKLFGYEAFRTVYVTDAILGRRDDVGRWVGGNEGAFVNTGTNLHGLAIQLHNDEVTAFVRLFMSAGDNVPEYVVAVGRVDPSMIVVDGTQSKTARG